MNPQRSNAPSPDIKSKHSSKEHQEKDFQKSISKSQQVFEIYGLRNLKSSKKVNRNNEAQAFISRTPYDNIISQRQKKQTQIRSQSTAHKIKTHQETYVQSDLDFIYSQSEFCDGAIKPKSSPYMQKNTYRNQQQLKEFAQAQVRKSKKQNEPQWKGHEVRRPKNIVQTNQQEAESRKQSQSFKIKRKSKQNKQETNREQSKQRNSNNSSVQNKKTQRKLVDKTAQKLNTVLTEGGGSSIIAANYLPLYSQSNSNAEQRIENFNFQAQETTFIIINNATTQAQQTLNRLLDNHHNGAHTDNQSEFRDQDVVEERLNNDELVQRVSMQQFSNQQGSQVNEEEGFGEQEDETHEVLFFDFQNTPQQEQTESAPIEFNKEPTENASNSEAHFQIEQNVLLENKVDNNSSQHIASSRNLDAVVDQHYSPTQFESKHKDRLEFRKTTEESKTDKNVNFSEAKEVEVACEFEQITIKQSGIKKSPTKITIQTSQTNLREQTNEELLHYYSGEQSKQEIELVEHQISQKTEMIWPQKEKRISQNLEHATTGLVQMPMEFEYEQDPHQMLEEASDFLQQQQQHIVDSSRSMLMSKTSSDRLYQISYRDVEKDIPISSSKKSSSREKGSLRSQSSQSSLFLNSYSIQIQKQVKREQIAKSLNPLEVDKSENNLKSAALRPNSNFLTPQKRNEFKDGLTQSQKGQANKPPTMKNFFDVKTRRKSTFQSPETQRINFLKSQSRLDGSQTSNVPKQANSLMKSISKISLLLNVNKQVSFIFRKEAPTTVKEEEIQKRVHSSRFIGFLQNEIKYDFKEITRQSEKSSKIRLQKTPHIEEKSKESESSSSSLTSSKSSSSSSSSTNKREEIQINNVPRNRPRRKILPTIRLVENDDVGIIPDFLPLNIMNHQFYLRMAAEQGINATLNSRLNQKFIRNQLNTHIVQVYNQAMKNMRERDQAMVEGLLESSSYEGTTSRPAAYDILRSSNIVKIHRRRRSFVRMKYRLMKSLDRFVINPYSTTYQIFYIIRVICAMIEFMMYPLFMILGTDKIQNYHFVIFAVCQVVFIFDIIMNFFLAYKETNFGGELVLDSETIRKRYFRKRFFGHLVVLFPIGFIHNNLKYLSLIKFLRIQTLLETLSTKYYKDKIRNYYEKKLNKVLLDLNLSTTIIYNANFVKERFNTQNFMHLVKMLLMVLAVIFLATVLWLIVVIQSNNILDDIGRSNDNTFFKFYGFSKRESFDQFILVAYFSFTTLGTVGFGDVVPKNDIERVACAFILLFGVAMFTYVYKCFFLMLDSLRNYNQDYEQEGALNQFLNVFIKFNKSKPLNQSIKARIQEFFRYYWIHNRNICIREHQDVFLFEQIPNQVRFRLFQDFLFHDFVEKFKRFLRFRRSALTGSSGGNAFLKGSAQQQNSTQKLDYHKYSTFPFVGVENSQYQVFMVDLLRSLEPRFFKRKELIYDEREEVQEMYFICNGSFDVGFSIDKKPFYKLRFGPRNIIGAFNMFFEATSLILIRSYTFCEGYGVRKQLFKELMKKCPDFERQLIIYSYDFYEQFIQKPLNQMKKAQIRKMKQKRHTVLALDPDGEHRIDQKQKLTRLMVEKELKTETNKKIQQELIETEQSVQNIDIKMEHLHLILNNLLEVTESTLETLFCNKLEEFKQHSLFIKNNI